MPWETSSWSLVEATSIGVSALGYFIAQTLFTYAAFQLPALIAVASSPSRFCLCSGLFQKPFIWSPSEVCWTSSLNAFAAILFSLGVNPDALWQTKFIFWKYFINPGSGFICPAESTHFGEWLKSSKLDCPVAIPEKKIKKPIKNLRIWFFLKFIGINASDNSP